MAVILCADRTSDLSEELMEQYHIHTQPYHILLDGKEYLDGIDICPEDIYNVYHEKHILPKTSAVNVGEYLELFRPYVEAGDEVVHFNLGSALSSSHQNALLAAAELGNVYVIDGRNLSCGVALQVVDAAKMIAEGKNAVEIKDYFDQHHGCYHASFLVDSLEFLHAGGRCSSAAAFSAGLLNIRPGIDVDNSDGSMTMGKKYRGSLEKVLAKYFKDKLSAYDDICLDRVFVPDSGCLEPGTREKIDELILNILPFKEIIHVSASCTISSHCGPRVVGLMFSTNTPSK
ncbi:MAG: DegV family protein [Firmicutes bacterium]|nr:DegV family protein [Bacillota bacterium]